MFLAFLQFQGKLKRIKYGLQKMYEYALRYACIARQDKEMQGSVKINGLK